MQHPLGGPICHRDGMITLGLPQIVTGPTHFSSHSLDLAFCSGQGKYDLSEGDLCRSLLSWSDHYLVSFKLIGTLNVGVLVNVYNVPAQETYGTG